MSVYVAWSPALVDPTIAGPWLELRPVADGLWLVHSDDTLSRVFHELKWSFAEPDADAPLLVVPVGATPKLRGLSPGTLTWLRERTPYAAGTDPDR